MGKAVQNEKHKERKAGWKAVTLSFIIIFLIIFAYAVLRYNVFKGVGIEHIPLYILNKALALVSVVLIGLSFAIGPLCRFWPKKFVSKLYLRKYFGLFGFGVASIHGLISLILFNPAYYPKFFAEGGKLTFEGELSMLFGVLAIFIFAVVSVTSLPSVEREMHEKQWKFIQRIGYLAYVFVLLHITFMGYKGWFNPTDWPGGMYPITLLALVFILFVLLIRVIVALFPRRE